jgi:uncharacterized membrane protein YdjX (TVP38/TMEM64 family)
MKSGQSRDSARAAEPTQPAAPIQSPESHELTLPWHRRVWKVLTRRRGSPIWTAVVRATGVLGLLAIGPTLVWPDVAAFVGFTLVTIVVNGPLSPFFPATYEPILMALGRAYPPALVGFVGILGILYIEYVNYHLYSAALLHPPLEGFRGRRLVRWAVDLFQKQPFFAVWLCSWSPLPYWSVRMVAPLANYPIGPYLLATFLGRYPRLWFFAAMGGVIPVPTSWLIAMAVTLSVIGLSVAAWRRWGRKARPTAAAAAPDADE